MQVTFQQKQYTIPTGYNTLSWGKYIEVQDAILQMELVSRVLGIPYDEFLLCNDIKGLSELNAVLAFLKVAPVIDNKPYLITVDGHVVMTPKSLDKVTFAQYQDIALIMGKEEMASDEKITTIVAIASMKDYFGAYDSDKLEAMTATIKQCTVQSVLDTYTFFLRNLNGSKSGILPTSSKWAILKRKLWQALKSLSGSGF